MSKKLRQFILGVILFVLGLLFIAKFAGAKILTLYIKTGIGDCKKNPILCMAPKPDLLTQEAGKEFKDSLIPYQFPKMSIRIPRDFSVVQEMIKKFSYKKYKHQDTAAIIYCLYLEPGAFVLLYPQLRKAGVADNYEFIKRTMSADLENIKGISDAFFVIMKGIFTPDLGNQLNVKMAAFSVDNKRGFINYNLEPKQNLFDCSILDSRDGFFKIYIKDKLKNLDLEKVLTIISTASSD